MGLPLDDACSHFLRNVPLTVLYFRLLNWGSLSDTLLCFHRSSSESFLLLVFSILFCLFVLSMVPVQVSSIYQHGSCFSNVLKSQVSTASCPPLSLRTFPCALPVDSDKMQFWLSVSGTGPEILFSWWSLLCYWTSRSPSECHKMAL